MVTLPTYYGTMRAYQLISGSDGTAHNAAAGGNGYTPNSGSYGLFLPDISTLLFNSAALSGSAAGDGGIGLATNQGADTFGDNPTKLYDAISGSAGGIISFKKYVA